MATFHPDPGTNRIRRQGVGALFFFGLALVMYFLSPPQQQEVAALLRASVLRPFIATQEIVSRTGIQTREAAELQREMDSLVSVMANQTTLAEENRRLRALLRLDRRIGVDYRAASLLRPGTEGSESMFLLQVEGEAEVPSGAPVIVPEGLVGVVRDVGPGGAIGMDWTHPDFRASAMTADGTTYGIVEPARDLQNGASLILTGTPFTTRVEPGTWIVTSGRGGVYPRGIPVGTVAGLTESEGGWRKSYGVEPAVELGAVTHALVGVGKTVVGPRLPSPDTLGPADTTDLRPIMLEGRFPAGEGASGDSVAGGRPPGNP
ncbi:MAG: rod shape-determining protein MreC [Longimicrobiales bacterium]